MPSLNINLLNKLAWQELSMLTLFYSRRFNWLFMKYLILPVVMFLASCQSLPGTDNADIENPTNDPELQTAGPIEINQALLADESIDIIHPVADVDFSLNNTLKDQKSVGLPKRLFFLTAFLTRPSPEL